jgi:hypothetical protein
MTGILRESNPAPRVICVACGGKTIYQLESKIKKLEEMSVAFEELFLSIQYEDIDTDPDLIA